MVASSKKQVSSSTGPTTLTSAPSGTIGFQSKDERLAHIDESKTILVHVIIPSSVAAHFSGGDTSAVLEDPLSVLLQQDRRGGSPSSPLKKATKRPTPPDNVQLSASIPANSNVHATVCQLFDTWMEVRTRAGLRPTLHDGSLYRRISDPNIDVDGDKAALALLQADLTLGISDATGKVLKPLKRLFVPRSSSNVVAQLGHVPSSKTGTVSSMSTQLLAHYCSLTGKAISQKSMLSILSTFVEPAATNTSSATASATVAEAVFNPPYMLAMYVPDDVLGQRKIMFLESIRREAIVARQYEYFSRFAVPYFGDILQADTQLRTDWIMYQGHCRHRLHATERQERHLCQQQVAQREECDTRHAIEQEEMRDREVMLCFESEKLITHLCAVENRRQAVEHVEHKERQRLRALFEREGFNTQRLAATKTMAETFVSSGGQEIYDSFSWAMLNVFHEAVKQVTSSNLRTRQ